MTYTVKLDLNCGEHVWKAWINTVRDYEKNVLTTKHYPPYKVLAKQKKERYNFWLVNEMDKIIEFESEKDFTYFLLKWG